MRDEISAYKRDRILEEAVKLFYERGFSGTTLDDIAGKLGVTKPFIYTHFRSKCELLEAVCRPTIEMSLDAISRAAQREGRAADRLFDGIVSFTKVVLQRQGNIAVYFREEKHLSEAGLSRDQCAAETLRPRAERPAAGRRGCRGIPHRRRPGGRACHRRHGELGIHLVPAGGRLSFDDIGARLAHFALQMVEAQPAAELTAQT